MEYSNENNSVRVTWKNQYSINAEDDDLKASAGDDFDKCFKEEKTVSVKSTVLTNDAKLKEFLSKFTDDEIAKYFKVSKKIVAKDDLDRKLFESKDLRKNLLESGAVKQTKAITLEK